MGRFICIESFTLKRKTIEKSGYSAIIYFVSTSVLILMVLAGSLFTLIYIELPAAAMASLSMFGDTYGLEKATEEVDFKIFGPDFKVAVDDSNKIVYTGEITEDGASSLKRTFWAHSAIRALEIHSGGGSVDYSKEIARFAARNSLDVVVSHQNTKTVDCGSACVNVIAGVIPSNQKIDPDARILFHVTRVAVPLPGSLYQFLAHGCEILISVQCQEAIGVALYDTTPTKAEFRLGQAKTADRLEGVHDGNLRHAIEMCKPNPFETLQGITITWKDLQRIIHTPTSDLSCPDISGGLHPRLRNTKSL